MAGGRRLPLDLKSLLASRTPNSGIIGSEHLVEPLIALLDEDEIIERRKDAALILGFIGDERAVEPLIASLKGDKADSVRGEAACALGMFLRDDRVVEPLIASLHDDADSVRGEAACALVTISRDIPFVEKLVPLLGDEDSNVRGAAAWIIRSTGDYRPLNQNVINSLIRANLLITSREQDAIFLGSNTDEEE